MNVLFASTLGKRYLERMLKDGFTTALETPLLFLLTQKLDKNDQVIVDKIEAIRSKMSKQKDVFVEVYSSPDPVSLNKTTPPDMKPAPGKIITTSLSYIASTVSVLPYWGAFLYLCAKETAAKTILRELGSCAGISSCYLASSNSQRFITIEASAALAELARCNLNEVTAGRFRVIHALFDTGLEELLPTLPEGLDLLYIDGQHEKTATLHLVERLASVFNTGSILIFDDIRWTSDMWETWQLLTRYPGFSWTLDTGRFGLCMWDRSSRQPRQYDISGFTAFWKKGKPH